jgi:tetratricopeptide (TPR) repeat protein
MSVTDIELRVSRVHDGTFTVDLRVELSTRPNYLVENVPIALSNTDLLALSTSPDEYGSKLTEMVFVPKLQAEWKKVCGFADGRDGQLRVRLALQGDDSLHTIRWELLQNPDDHTLLAHNERILFSRFLSSKRLSEVETVDYSEIRAAIAIANPASLTDFNLAPINVEEEVERAKHGLGDIQLRVLDGRAGRPSATLQAIAAALRDGFHILYIVCHGSYSKEGAHLWLEQEEGSAQGKPVTGERFIHTFQRSKHSPLLVVLTTCQGAGNNYEMLTAIGPQLTQTGVGAVLAMQGDVPMELVASLIPRFFEELRRDGRIDRALAAARADLPEDSHWWMPTLWMSMRDGHLWEGRGQAPDSTVQLPDTWVPPVAPLSPGHFIPFHRNKLFVGRTDDLKRLARLLMRKEPEEELSVPTVVITGIGGIGKTNLATEFVHRYGKFFAGNVYWINMSSDAAARADLVSLGEPGFLNLDTFSHLSEDAKVRFVQAELNKPVPRLIVFDNCEDEQLLDTWRPTTGGCRIIVTSRRQQWDISLGVRLHSLNTLERFDSIALLCKFRPDLAQDTPALEEIAAELGDLPLALHLAGSYLRYSDEAPATYLVDLRNVFVLRHESLEPEGDQIRLSPTRHDPSIRRTFAISYRKLSSEQPIYIVARSLLARAAYFASNEPIPRDLLLATITASEQDAQKLGKRALNLLISLGLLEETNQCVKLHRLLQLYVLEETAVPVREKSRTTVEGLFINLLDRQGWEQFDPRTLPMVRKHVLEVAEDLVTYYTSDSSRVPDYNTALFIQRQLNEHLAQWGAYRAVAEQSIKLLPYLVNATDQLVLYLQMGEALRQIGCFQEAIDYLRNAAEAADDQGDQDKKSASLGSLGNLYADEGMYREAIHVYAQALEAAQYQQNLSLQAKWHSNLGDCHFVEGRTNQAIEHCTLALDLVSQMQRREPFRAICYSNLAIYHDARGQTAQAIDYYEKALIIAREQMNSHLEAASLGGIGDCYVNLGQITVAEDLLSKALSISQEYGLKLTEAHILHSQAQLRLDQQRLEDASAKIQEVDAVIHAASSSQIDGDYRSALARWCLLSDDYRLSSADRATLFAPISQLSPRSKHSIAALLGCICLREGSPSEARDYFLTAIEYGHQLLDIDEHNYQALDTLGLAYSGLTLIEPLDHVADAKRSYTRARTICSEPGVTNRVLQLFNSLRSIDTRNKLGTVYYYNAKS